MIKITIPKSKPKITIPKSKPKRAGAANGVFEVRPGTAAICADMMGDNIAGRLFHGILELWVETRKKVVRKQAGKDLGFIIVSMEELQTLTGLSKYQIRDHALPKLKESPLFTVVSPMRLSPAHPNKIGIHFDQEAFWAEIVHILKPLAKVEEKVDGHTFIKKHVDRKQLPYLFKRLYDGVTGAGEGS